MAQTNRPHRDRRITTDPGEERSRRWWSEFEMALVAEMKQPALVVEYVETLRRACGDSLGTAQELYMNLARDLWGPLGLAFLDWVVSTVPNDAVLVFALRDAGWLYKLAETHPELSHHRRFALHLNRPLLNIRDDDGRLVGNTDEYTRRKYLAPILDPKIQERIVIIDTGCWGRVQQFLWNAYRLKYQARFFFSHNAFIPSWMEVMGVRPDIAEVLCDSLETALPNQYRRVEELKQQREGAVPVMVFQGHIQRYLYEGTSLGLTEAERPEDAYDLIRSAVGKHIHSREEGQWTGVLPQNVPTWIGGVKFLEQYPPELRAVNPPHLLPGSLNPRRRKVNLTKLGL